MPFFEQFHFTVTVPRVLICFAFAFLTTFIVRFALGQYRDLWFRRSPRKSFVTIRSDLSMHMALGYPICLQGYIVTTLLLLAIFIECFIILII